MCVSCLTSTVVQTWTTGEGNDLSDRIRISIVSISCNGSGGINISAILELFSVTVLLQRVCEKHFDI